MGFRFFILSSLLFHLGVLPLAMELSERRATVVSAGHQEGSKISLVKFSVPQVSDAPPPIVKSNIKEIRAAVPKRVVEPLKVEQSDQMQGVEREVHDIGEELAGTGDEHVLIFSPKPPYPYRARKIGFEGVLELEVQILSDGLVGVVELVKSSGREDCDRVAISTVKERWRFKPATRMGLPVPSTERVRIRYELK